MANYYRLRCRTANRPNHDGAGVGAVGRRAAGPARAAGSDAATPPRPTERRHHPAEAGRRRRPKPRHHGPAAGPRPAAHRPRDLGGRAGDRRHRRAARTPGRRADRPGRPPRPDAVVAAQGPHRTRRDRRADRHPGGRRGDRHPGQRARRARQHRLLVRDRRPTRAQDGAPLPDAVPRRRALRRRRRGQRGGLGAAARAARRGWPTPTNADSPRSPANSSTNCTTGGPGALPPLPHTSPRRRPQTHSHTRNGRPDATRHNPAGGRTAAARDHEARGGRAAVPRCCVYWPPSRWWR